MNVRILLAMGSLLVVGCTSPTEKAWHQGAIGFARAFAQTGDAACRVEPTCMQALAALSSIPEGAPEHELAEALLGRIQEARKAQAGTTGQLGPPGQGGPPGQPGTTTPGAQQPGLQQGTAAGPVAALPPGAAKAPPASPSAPGAPPSEKAVSRDQLAMQGAAPGSEDEAGDQDRQHRTGPPGHRSVQLRGWRNDAEGYRAAMKAHHHGKRPLVLYFCEDAEEHCAMLDRMFEDERVRQALGSAERVRIVPGRSEADHAVARRYEVRGFPTLLLIPAGTDHPVRLHPFTSRVDGQARMEAAEDFAADLSRALR